MSASDKSIRFREERATGGSTDDIGFGIVYDVYEDEGRLYGVLVQMSGTAGAIAENNGKDAAAILRDHAETWARKALDAPNFQPPAQGEFVRALIAADHVAFL